MYIKALGNTHRKKELSMECFIVENGVERKAKLEDLLPLIGDAGIQHLLLNALRSNIDLPYVFAHMPDEIKNQVYRNLPSRVSRRIEKSVENIESTYAKEDDYFEYKKSELMALIRESRYMLWSYNDLVRIVWKDKVPIEKTLEKEPLNPIEKLIKKIEEACNSGNLYFPAYDAISKDDIKNAFAAFQDRKSELQKIRTLSIGAKDLPAAALLFEAGAVDDLEIKGDFDGTWPDFFEKRLTLLSINLNLSKDLTELPPFIRNAVSLRCLSITSSNITLLPDWIGDMQSLKELYIHYENKNLKTLPDSIGNLTNLAKLYIDCPSMEKLPDSIGNLISLKKLLLFRTKNLTSLPESIGNLKNLVTFMLEYSPLKTLPDWIGNLQNLTELSLSGNKTKRLPDFFGNLSNLTVLHLENCKNLRSLPDSIGSLKNLVDFYLTGSPIEKLPDSMANCFSLECIIEVIPEGHCGSYRTFCNYYYTLVETIISFAAKARREGLLALEEELGNLSDGFFKQGLRLVVDGTDEGIIRHILTLKIEREHDHYKKKLMETAMEGILCIQNANYIPHIAMRLAAMVDIKNNPLDTALAKYLAGDNSAFDGIDFKAALQPEEEREEVRFIKRAYEISEICRRDGPFGIEKHLNNDGIAAKDVFEYGLCLIVECWNYEDIDKDLTMLIANETDPVQKNIALAKKDAVKMIYDGDNPRIIRATLLAYFDNEVEKYFLSELDD
jgi:flagellar motor component MotA